MVQFSVPDTHDEECFRFSVAPGAVLLAGSRHRDLDAEVCTRLVHAFWSLRIGFLTGCAPGVDSCFRRALSHAPYREWAFIGCAFPRRPSHSRRLFTTVVVPPGLPSAVALARRTLYLVKRCALLLVFPDDPHTGAWGKGSKLAFRTCVSQLKPAFVVSTVPPPASAMYRIFPASLFGVVSGYWVVPHTVSDGGACDDL